MPFKRIPPAPVDSVVVVGASGVLRDVYLGNGKGGGDPGALSSGTARTVALTASAVRARNYAGAARAAFCGTAAHMGDAKSKGVDLAAIGHGALDLLGFIPGIGAAADVANGLWYAAEGNYVDAAASLFSAIPGVGDAFGGANAARKAVKTGLSMADTTISAAKTGEVIRQNAAGTVKAIRMPDGSIDLVLRKKAVWNDSQVAQAVQKAKKLSEADTRVVPSSEINRNSKIAKEYRNRNKISSNFDIDHVIDLQLGGVDDVSNMSALDRSVNRSMGAQIHYLIKDLDANAVIGNVRFE